MGLREAGGSLIVLGVRTGVSAGREDGSLIWEVSGRRKPLSVDLSDQATPKWQAQPLAGNYKVQIAASNWKCGHGNKTM